TPRPDLSDSAIPASPDRVEERAHHAGVVRGRRRVLLLCGGRERAGRHGRHRRPRPNSAERPLQAAASGRVDHPPPAFVGRTRGLCAAGCGRSTVVYGRSTVVYGRSTVVYGQSTVVYGRSTSAYGRSTVVYRPINRCLWPINRCLRAIDL